MYGTVRSWKNSIMDVIGTELSELYAHYFIKTVTFDFVYILSSAYIDQSAPNFIFMSQQNLNEFDHGSNWTGTTGVIWSWIVKNCCIWLCLLSNIYKYKPISTKLGHNDYKHKISDEFDYGFSHTRSVGVLCPWNRKIELQLSIWYLSSLLSCTA